MSAQYQTDHQQAGQPAPGTIATPHPHAFECDETVKWGVHEIKTIVKHHRYTPELRDLVMEVFRQLPENASALQQRYKDFARNMGVNDDYIKNRAKQARRYRPALIAIYGGRKFVDDDGNTITENPTFDLSGLFAERMAVAELAVIGARRVMDDNSPFSTWDQLKLFIDDDERRAIWAEALSHRPRPEKPKRDDDKQPLSSGQICSIMIGYGVKLIEACKREGQTPLDVWESIEGAIDDRVSFTPPSEPDVVEPGEQKYPAIITNDFCPPTKSEPVVVHLGKKGGVNVTPLATPTGVNSTPLQTIGVPLSTETPPVKECSLRESRCGVVVSHTSDTTELVQDHQAPLDEPTEHIKSIYESLEPVRDGVAANEDDTTTHARDSRSEQSLAQQIVLNPEGIPPTMLKTVTESRTTALDLVQWVSWNYGSMRDNGKRSKEPSGYTNRPETWVSCARAIEMRGDGIGFQLTKGDPFVCVDLDDCLNPETGEIKERARAIIDRLDSFTEVSPSGKGIHVWCRGSLPGKKQFSRDREVLAIEMYEDRHFICVTGVSVHEQPRELRECTDELEKIYVEFLADPVKERKQSSKVVRGPVTIESVQKEQRPRLGIAGIYRRCRISSKNTKGTFERLYRGDLFAGEDRSKAEIVLLRMAAKFCATESHLVQFARTSKLVRDKWNEMTHYPDWGLSYIEGKARQAFRECWKLPLDD